VSFALRPSAASFVHQMLGAHATPSRIPSETRSTARNAPRSLCTRTRAPSGSARRAASCGCSTHSGSAPRRSDGTFTNVELRNWCRGDEISVSG
jgi:hypothetical protein